MAYQIIFAQSVGAQLQALTAGQRKTVLAAIQQHLTHQPLVETRNRKLLRPNPIAPWELRVGQFRVFYEVDSTLDSVPSVTDPTPGPGQGVVQILAVGQKRGSDLWIAGKKIQS